VVESPAVVVPVVLVPVVTVVPVVVPVVVPAVSIVPVVVLVLVLVPVVVSVVPLVPGILPAVPVVLPARGPRGSLAVSLGLVGAAYGLDLVETRPAIYLIHTVGVARLDTVVARAGVHLVAAFARDVLVVALQAVLPGATLEAVVSVCPHERIVAGGADQDLRHGFLPHEERTGHHYHHR
jgi:hypothetical protein